MSEHLFAKVIKCKTCSHDFSQEPHFELDDYGKLIKNSIYYHNECEICIHKIPKELFNVCKLYCEGLLTSNELVEKLQEIKV